MRIIFALVACHQFYSVSFFVRSEWKPTWLEWSIIMHNRLHLLRYLLVYVLYTGMKH